MGLGKMVSSDKTTVTKDELIKMFPQKKGTITEETVELINSANNDPYFNGDEFLNNMMDYQHIMAKNSSSIKEYITALKFCGYLIVEEENYTEAYKRARATDEFVIARRNATTDSNDYNELTYAASRYRKSRLVVDILTQAQVPWDLMFAGTSMRAVAVLADEMVNAAYSKDRITAAKAIVDIMKPQEQMKLQIDTGPNIAGVQESLMEQLATLTMNQKLMMDNGGDIRSVQKLGITTDIIDAEVE